MSRKKWLLLIVLIAAAILLVFILPEKKAQIRSAHFNFIFSRSIDTSKIRLLASALESNYTSIGNDLQTTPAGNIEVHVYASRWRYVQATGNWSASGSIEGVSKLHFVEQAWGEPDNRKVAVHEFTHAVTLKLLVDNEPQPLDAKKFDEKFANFPAWLWEALSVYEAHQFVDPKSVSFLHHNSYPGLAELNDRSMGGKIYKVGYTLVEYILHDYGHDKLIELIKNYGNIPSVLEVSDQQFLKDWYSFVKNKYLH